MTEEEAEGLSNHIKRWSENDQLINNKPALDPHVRPFENGSVYVVVLQGKYDYHVWSWIDWGMNFEPELVIPQEEEGIEA